MIEIPCCNFPTVALVLDDEEDFLMSVKRILRQEYKLHCLTSIQEAHDLIKKNLDWTFDALDGGVSRSFDTSEIANYSIMMDISKLHKQIYNPERFNHVSVMIIDYDMPVMNGLEFLRSLGNHQLKVIMLTGKASQETVIEAFNQGEIHRYISKGEPNYFKMIPKYINELQREFFLGFYKLITDSIKIETKILSNPEFIKLFDNTIKENDIVEYYLLDESGSFLMLDAAAKNQIWLIVKSEQEMQTLYELASEDPETPAYVIKKLKNREVLTHFKIDEESLLSAKYWNLIDAKPLEEGNFYYSVLRNDPDFEIERDKIKSYLDFLNG